MVLRTYASVLLPTDDGSLFIAGHMPQTNANNGLMEIFGQEYLPCDDGLPYHLSAISDAGAHQRSFAYGNRVDFLALGADEVFFQYRSVEPMPGDLAGDLAAAADRLVGVVSQSTGDVEWVQSGIGAAAAARTSGGAWVSAGSLETPIDWKGETVTPAGTMGYIAQFAP